MHASDRSERASRLSPRGRDLLRQRLQGSAADEGEPDAIPRRGEDGPAPLSPAQQRLWLVEQVSPGGALYAVSDAAGLAGPLRVPALRAALGEVVRRHESLRTVFGLRGGAPVQVVRPPAPLPLPLVDLCAVPPAAREAEARRRLTLEVRRPFDLERGPLFRALLLRLAEEEHVLLVCMHHIVSDGWSLGVLQRELSALYGAFSRGEPSPLAEPPLQYADYAVWQRERLTVAALEGQLAWWRERLAGAPELLELPTDRPRPAVQSFRGALEALTLPAELRESLRALGRAEGATLYMVLLAAFQALLARHGAGEDVVVGSPVAGRGRPETEGLVGFFVHTLVLRGDLSGDPTFRELLARVRESALGAFAHADVPFERLVEEVAPGRSLSHQPLVQVVFALQSAPGGTRALGDLRVRPVPFETGAARFDLGVYAGETEGGIRLEAEYATALFEAATIRRMLGRYRLLLEQAAAHPDRRLSELDLFAPGERERVVGEWNRTGSAYPSGSCIHEVFAARAAETPDAPAVEASDGRLSDAELERRAEGVARLLRGRGVGAESRVGVLAERSAEMVVWLLGILEAGGCYVPLDPGYPAERLRFMVEDAGISLLLVQPHLRDRLAGCRAEALSPGAEAEAGAGVEREGPPPGAAGPDTLAYVIYTSGSTGRPKGVAVPHRAVVRLVRGSDFAPLGPGDRVAQVSNAAFDAATWEIWGALLGGGCLVVVPRDVSLSPPDFAAEIAARRIGALFLTTALFNRVAREAPHAFGTLRHLLSGGEACDPEAVRRVLEAGRPERLLHVYGPTEGTTFSTWHRVREVEAGAASIPIGRAVANSRAYVLDAALRPAPVGVPGELYVGGDGLARGYLGRAELTAERFVPDPYSPVPGGRLYRTGDRARWREEGEIEFLGRVDHQVKVRGFRVEPGEVEAVLLEHPGVREAVVVLREDTPGDRRLVAYAAAEAGATAGELRAFLKDRLPDHLVPSAVALLDALPLTPSGKVDRRALPAPAPGAGSPGEGRAVPTAPMERMLAQLWREMLALEEVGIDDNFFDLGGHSLLASRLNGRLRETLGREVPMLDMFRYPTIRSLAAHLGAGETAPPSLEHARDRARSQKEAVLRQREAARERLRKR
ncbi:MAG TPA: amino acid adenylation domain-containing protein [Longimicrobiaceae bacterium]|nr:amino acid adenylation domain-containing protein [Longimicrobiaceae bacterium]